MDQSPRKPSTSLTKLEFFIDLLHRCDSLAVFLCVQYLILDHTIVAPWPVRIHAIALDMCLRYRSQFQLQMNGCAIAIVLSTRHDRNKSKNVKNEQTTIKESDDSNDKKQHSDSTRNKIEQNADEATTRTSRAILQQSNTKQNSRHDYTRIRSKYS